MRPYNFHSQEVFARYDLSQLIASTTFSHVFNNRSVAYYGNHTYTYVGGTHPPCSINNNPYLKTILDDVDKQFPEFKYNSAMVTQYSDGSKWIPFHSDDESCITPSSSIMTISLGETRTLQFSSKTDSPVEASLTLGHGDVVLMTQLSQNYFGHTIPRDDSNNIRISITLRNISECTNTGVISESHDVNLDGSLDNLQSSTKTVAESVSIKVKQSKPATVYISSSMFASLNPEKLSSQFQDAHVFHYPGATASGINHRFESDLQRKHLDTATVQKIILMCGSNNIDSVIGSPKHMRDKLLPPGSYTQIATRLDNANYDIENLIESLHKWAPNANINVVNILPRESRVRNEVISNINQFLSKLHNKYSYVNMISTEKNPDRYLFSDRLGFRKSLFFSQKGEDNVHLNREGVIRLAKHLKYHAHQG